MLSPHSVFAGTVITRETFSRSRTTTTSSTGPTVNVFQDGQTSGLVSSLFTWQEDLSSSVERACVVVVSLDVEILHLWRMRVDRIGRGGVHGLLLFAIYSKNSDALIHELS